MGLLNIKPFEGAAVGASGISIALAETRGVQFVRIGITEKAIQTYFGVLDPAKDGLTIIIDDDASKNHLIGLAAAKLAEQGAIPLSSGARGSVAIKLQPWCQMANGKRPAKQMVVTTAPKMGTVVLNLPEWARPPARKFHQGKSIMDRS